MRGNAPGLEPRVAPQAFAQRIELAEMRRSLDGRGLESDFLRHRVVVDRDVTIVHLRGQHLLRHAPRSDQRFAIVNNRGIERS
jgi:hypothetical protein